MTHFSFSLTADQSHLVETVTNVRQALIALMLPDLHYVDLQHLTHLLLRLLHQMPMTFIAPNS